MRCHAKFFTLWTLKTINFWNKWHYPNILSLSNTSPASNLAIKSVGSGSSKPKRFATQTATSPNNAPIVNMAKKP